MKTPPFLVQFQDSQGFWCNVSEWDRYDQAAKTAQIEANEWQKVHRVVCGPSRTSHSYFNPS